MAGAAAARRGGLRRGGCRGSHGHRRGCRAAAAPGAGLSLIWMLSRTLPTTACFSSCIWPAKSNCVVAAPPFAASATTEPGILIETGTR